MLQETALVVSFKAQIESHEQLRADYDKLKGESAELMRRREEDERALDAAMHAERRDAELIASLRQTIERYVVVAALSIAEDAADEPMTGESGTVERTAAAHTLLLEQRLEHKEAELTAARKQLAALSGAHAEIASLHASIDEHRVAARRAQQHARDHEAIAGEYEKKLKSLRDALGKAELDRQRKDAEHQRGLQEASKKLRSQKALSDQLQRSLQQERHEQQLQQQQGGRQNAQLFRPPAQPSVFGAQHRPGPTFAFGGR